MYLSFGHAYSWLARKEARQSLSSTEAVSTLASHLMEQIDIVQSILISPSVNVFFQ